MSVVDQTSPLLARIRAHAFARRDSAPRPSVPDGSERSVEAGRDWLADVARAVVAIDPKDPLRQRKAFRVYLRAALARELGIRCAEEPGFAQLVNDVLGAMESDPQLEREMTTAGASLLRAAGV